MTYKQLNDKLFIVDFSKGIFGESTLTIGIYDLIYGEPIEKPIKVRGYKDVDYFAVEVYERIKSYRPSKIMYSTNCKSSRQLRELVENLLVRNKYMKINKTGDLFYRE